MQDSPLSQYLLLFRGTDWPLELSPAATEEIMNRANAWFEGLFNAGKALGAQPLGAAGATVSWRNGTISDGPFVESKESVGGYLMLAVDSFDEAMAIARQNPLIPYGLQVEVRPISDECPLVRRVMENAAAAHV